MPPEAGSTATASTRLPCPPLIERFATGLEAVWPEGGRNPALRLGLAVSGGPDSTALLLLAAAAIPGRVEAATVDHRLRPESADEAAGVARLCERLGIAHRILEVDVAAGNLQAEARRARYAALQGWVTDRGLAALATAHHADDQAETLFLRLNRASGVAGLAGARARGSVPGTGIALLRPLLDWRRAELVALVEATGVAAVDDPSNRDDRYDRARLRKALSDAEWLDIAAVAQSAGHLADADAALEWAAQREWKHCVDREAFGLKYRVQAPKAIALRVMARIIAEMGGGEPRGSVVARAYEALASGRPTSICDLTARPNVGGWSFTKAPTRRSVK